MKLSAAVVCAAMFGSTALAAPAPAHPKYTYNIQTYKDKECHKASKIVTVHYDREQGCGTCGENFGGFKGYKVLGKSVPEKDDSFLQAVGFNAGSTAPCFSSSYVNSTSVDKGVGFCTGCVKEMYGEEIACTGLRLEIAGP